MEPKTMLNADYLDIIFNNRNKSYGGYELRRNYNRRVKKTAGIMALGIAALLSFSFIAARHNEVIVKPNKTPTTICNLRIPPVLPPAHPATPPPQPAPAQHPSAHGFTLPKIVIDKQVPDDKQMPAITDMHHTEPGLSNEKGDPSGIGTGGTGTSKSSGMADMGKKSDNPMRWVEQMPQFTGNMNDYMSSHLIYPEGAITTQISGKVIVEFVVNEDGTVSNVKVLRGIGGGCDEEAVRMVSGMPKWKPGKQNGIPVKVLFTLPINFVLN